MLYDSLAHGKIHFDPIQILKQCITCIGPQTTQNEHGCTFKSPIRTETCIESSRLLEFSNNVMRTVEEIERVPDVVLDSVRVL